VPAVQLGVAGVAGTAALDGVEGGTLQVWGVPLDEQEVVRSPADGDVPGRLAAGVERVRCDHRAFQVHVLEQLFHPGRLGRAVRDPDLRDHGAALVQHRGEQLDLPVPDAPQPLPADRDHARAFPRPALAPAGALRRAGQGT